MGAAGGSAAKAAPTESYSTLLEQMFPAANNNSDPENRAFRDAMLTMKEYGYEDF
jgi:hypothetical protein